MVAENLPTSSVGWLSDVWSPETCSDVTESAEPRILDGSMPKKK